jgi:transposase
MACNRAPLDDPRIRRRVRRTADRGCPLPVSHSSERAGQRWHVERTNAWHNNFNRLQRCYERKEEVIDAFFDLADTIITVRRLIRESWTLYRWDGRPAKRP